MSALAELNIKRKLGIDISNALLNSAFRNINNKINRKTLPNNNKTTLKRKIKNVTKNKTFKNLNTYKYINAMNNIVSNPQNVRFRGIHNPHVYVHLNNGRHIDPNFLRGGINSAIPMAFRKSVTQRIPKNASIGVINRIIKIRSELLKNKIRRYNRSFNYSSHIPPLAAYILLKNKFSTFSNPRGISEITPIGYYTTRRGGRDRTHTFLNINISNKNNPRNLVGSNRRRVSS